MKKIIIFYFIILIPRIIYCQFSIFGNFGANIYNSQNINSGFCCSLGGNYKFPIDSNIAIVPNISYNLITLNQTINIYGSDKNFNYNFNLLGFGLKLESNKFFISANLMIYQPVQENVDYFKTYEFDIGYDILFIKLVPMKIFILSGIIINGNFNNISSFPLRLGFQIGWM